MKKLLVIFILLGITDCLAKVTWYSEINHKKCDVFIQVNEDNKVLYIETMHIPGQYMTTHCYETSATACHVKQDEVSYINGMKKNGTATFSNKENQICYFENLGLSVGNMAGIYTQPWSYVSSVNIYVSCEDSSSIPRYCAKTEKMAQQVLLAKEELDCVEKGGDFEGGIYPFKMPNDSTEYCVAGRCDICGSWWYKKFVEHWKDSVCCENRGKEPNINNGKCISPSPFDSTKVGVKHSKITAFPGCSKADAGENKNFCNRNESSSSTGSSSSAEIFSSSSLEESSSSEEQEEGLCDFDADKADAILKSAEKKCQDMQMESGYSLDGDGCLIGECYGEINSSDDEDELSSSSERESSSSAEEECIDVSLKKTSDEDADQWIYVGKETYTSRTVSYEEITPSSGFFDALGRMYRAVKSRIKYFMGIDTKVKKTVEIGEELDVWKRNFIDFSGNEAVSYIKRNNEWNIYIDSSIYFDDTYSVLEINNKKNYLRSRMADGIESYDIYDEFNNIKRRYSVSVDGDSLEENLDNYATKIDYVLNENANVLKKASYKMNFKETMETYNVQSFVLNDNQYSCSEFEKNVDEAIPAVCEHPHKPSNNFFEDTDGQLFYPGLRVDYIDKETKEKKTANNATFGELKMAPSTNIHVKCNCIEKDIYVHDYEIEYDKDAYIIIYASNWIYNVDKETWERKCWRTKDMKKTYDHEMGHYRNRINYAYTLANKFLVTRDNYKESGTILDSKQKCIKHRDDMLNLIYKTYNEFRIKDKKHEGDGKFFPLSPQPTSKDNRKNRDVPCTK